MKKTESISGIEDKLLVDNDTVGFESDFDRIFGYLAKCDMCKMAAAFDVS